MIIGDKLKILREQKRLSQGDIERRTGMLRCYISRVENGHTVPSVETLEKFAHALEVPIYQFFYEGTNKPSKVEVTQDSDEWGSRGRDAKNLNRLRRLLQHTSAADQHLLMFIAAKMSQRKNRRRKSRRSH